MRDRLGLYRDITYIKWNNTYQAFNHTGEWTLRSSIPKRFIKVGSETYELPAHHLPPDPAIVYFLLNLSFHYSIRDLGAGVGQYGRYILYGNPNAKYLAFDGGEGLSHFTGNFVARTKLHIFQPYIPVMDWVVSLEVGEHIPFVFEKDYILNLHAHNTKGILLSWAQLGQFGHGHINNHSPSYIQRLFSLKGYTLDRDATWSIRRQALYPWFKHNIYVFRRSDMT